MCRTDVGPSPSSSIKTYTFGGLFEQRDRSDGVHYVFTVPLTHAVTLQFETLIAGGVAKWTTSHYVLLDHLGSANEVVEGGPAGTTPVKAGTSREPTRFRAFGARADWLNPNVLPAPPNPDPGGTGILIGFAGHDDRDGDLGLIDMGGRVYDPMQGRFLSRDPVAPDPTRPTSMNPYVYGRNDPIDNTDPTGLAPVSSFGSIGVERNPDQGQVRVDAGNTLYFDFTYFDPTAAPPSPLMNNQSDVADSAGGARGKGDGQAAAVRGDGGDDWPASLPHVIVGDDGTFVVVHAGHGIDAASSPDGASEPSNDTREEYVRAEQVRAQGFKYNQDAWTTVDGTPVRHDCSGTCAFILGQSPKLTSDGFNNGGKGLPGFVETDRPVDGGYAYFTKGNARYAHVTVFLKDASGALRAWRASGAGPENFGWSRDWKQTLQSHLDNKQEVHYFAPAP